MLAATVVGVVFLLGLVNGQTKPACVDERVQAGFSLLPHEEYCELFYKCDTALFATEMKCGAGLFFHSEKNICDYPQSAVCGNWDCVQGQTYPSICCDRYFTCNGEGGYTVTKCENGETYSRSERRCVLNSGCQNHPKCPSSLPVGGTVAPVACRLSPATNGDECSYVERVEGYEDLVRRCPAGASFNQSMCMCSTLNNNCLSNPAWYAIKNFDTECKASMRLDFSDMNKVTVTTDKLGSVNSELPFEFQKVGVTISPGNREAVFGNDPTVATSYLYSYYFNSNQLSAPLAISITFRVQLQTGNQLSFNLLQNNFHSVCDNEETLRVGVVYNGGTYTVTIAATGASDVGINLQNQIQGNTQASISTSGFVQLRLFFDGRLSGQLIDRGANGNSVGNTVDIPATNNLGAFIASNKCGFEIGEGFRGQLREFTVYEGCGNFGNVV